ncbi:tripartite tricarboxylate transporter substrate binding protein [Bradyrhizobium sp. NP1]|uniref:tripartite tricarboxylate transporter substrate binding protein n=1 Tax=Bradyrhizobium sp. NP1 TaxID=3049772 RepID=UPI0025A58FBC|nr:tripartite tricarboxylate transporter substrate binding protein [Bradyrhizobium sp. NP1]WJR75414.1 tripartite tricarboxylate transporter substrate binding protein [Bradyrhizobium sp. NP1]
MSVLKFCLGLLLVLLLPATGIAQSSYPTHPVRLIVGFGPGAAADLTARVLGQRLSKTMGQQFVVENKPGGGSTVAAEQVARAPKDGYTLFVGTAANVINGVIQPNLPFDFARDFAPIAYTTSSPNILVVHPSTGVSDVKGLIALAKTKPEQIFFGSSGVGTAPHLSGELFNMMAGTKMVHVPYSGSAQAVTDLLAGRIQVMFSPASTVLQYVASGQLKALASSELTRAAAAPDLPTVAEAGLPGFDTSVWFGIVGPAGMPRETVEALSRAINEALKAEEVMKPLHAAGLDIKGGTPEAFGAYIASETKKWNDVVTTAGLRN